MNCIFLSDDMLSMLSSIFPELSDKQLETSVMFASGVSLEDMACLRAVIQTRLSIFSLQNQVRMCSMMESL